MLEAKLELAANELINNNNPRKFQLYLENVGELLLNIPYFKKFMEAYSDLGPLTYINLLNHLNFKIYQPRTIIWDYNDIVDGIYLIISGEVNIFKPPDKSNLIRCKNVAKRKKSFDNKSNIQSQINKITTYEKLGKNKNKQPFKLSQFTFNLMQKRPRVFGSNIFKPTKNIIIKRNIQHKLRKCETAVYTSILNLYPQENKNISKYEKEITLTEKNYIYREPQESRNLNYVETFGKIIGEDAMLQELTYRRYACETSTKCILAFLNAKNYHAFFDKINNTNKGSIVTFLFRLNYFNDKNDFIHKLCRITRIKSIKKGMNVYKKNSPLLSMYIIKNGNVSLNIVKTTKYKSDLNPDLLISNREIKNQNKNNSVNYNKNKINEMKNFPRFTKERTFEINGEYYEDKLYTLINYGKGEILGNIEYFLQLKNYLFTAKCLTDVELYEIELRAFNSIIRPYNFEFFEQKTKEQIDYLTRRVKEIKFIHEKNDEDQYKSRNKFMRIIYQKHPLSSLKIDGKYINDGKYYIPINLKYTMKKMKNTKISPFCLYELASAVSQGKVHNSKNPFITNNVDYTKIFNENNSKQISSLNVESRKFNKDNSIINLNNKIKLENKKESFHNKNHRMSASVGNIEKRSKKFRIASTYERHCQIIKIENRYKSLEKKNKSEIDKGNNEYNTSKKSMRFSFSSLNFNFKKYERKSIKFMTNFVNMYQKAKKENFEKQEQKLKEKKYKLVKKKEIINNTIAFDGYRVYLNNNMKDKISKRKNDDMK